MNRQQNVVVGAFLIGLALVWWLHLGWLVWPGVLAAAGVVAYNQRRKAGRVTEAVQAGLWLLGLSLVFLLHVVFPGIVLLIGASILIRGREQQVDDQIQQLVQNATKPRSTGHSLPTQHVPVTAPTTKATGSEQEYSTTGETTRL